MSPVAAQQLPAREAKLNIAIVAGGGTINRVRRRVSRTPVVQVENENHRPVAGATVRFTLPDSGPSGLFANGTRTLTVRTDRNGRAAAKGILVNNISGELQIQVLATYRGEIATISITQINSTQAGSGRFSRKRVAILAAVGAAVATGVVLVIRNRNSESKISISAGTPTVGGPQ